MGDDAPALNGKGNGMMSELKFWIWLAELFPKGSDKPNALLDIFERPEDIFAASQEELARTQILSEQEVERILRHSLERSAYIVSECERLKMKAVTMENPLYPNRLKTIFGAPVVLYVYGDISGIDENVVLGIVGTREPSEYGKTITERLSYELVSAGAAVVSGCAVGIDTAAHTGALRAKGKTYAVLGCGLDIDYPVQSNRLKKQILRQSGALISELPPGTTVSGKYFPTRNRLISGLSLGVMVTEAPQRSGSIISLNHALEQGRDTFCVPPHDLYDSRYQGVVIPLRDYAKAVYDVNDILFEYYGAYSHKLSADKAVGEYVRQAKDEQAKTGKAVSSETSPAPEKKEQKSPPPELGGDKKLVYDALETEPQYVNDIAGKTKLPLQVILPVLTELEIMGVAVSYSGQRYGKM